MKTNKADPETRLKSGKENFGYSSDEARAAREYQAGHRKTFRGRCGLPGHQLLKQKNLGTGSKQCLDDFYRRIFRARSRFSSKAFSLFKT